MAENYYGQVLFALGRPGVLYYSFWQGIWDDLNVTEQINDPSLHFYQNGSLIDSSVSAADAASGQVILFQGTFGGLVISTNIGDGSQLFALSEGTSVFRLDYNWETGVATGNTFTPGFFFELNGQVISSVGEVSMTLPSIDDSFSTLTVTFTYYVEQESRRRTLVPVTATQTLNRNPGNNGYTRPSNQATIFNSAPGNIGALTGSYENNDYLFSICMTNGEMNATIASKDGSDTVGFFDGECDTNFVVCNGIYLFNGTKGSFTISVTASDTLHIEWYPSTIDQGLMLPAPNLREFFDITSNGGSVTPSTCATGASVLFEGEFTDPIYTGPFFVCESTPTELSGVYSKVGLVRGTFDPLSGVWEGRWYEPGVFYADGETTTAGPISLKIIDFDHFEGTYGFDSLPGQTFNWGSVTRISYDVPDTTECWRFSASPSARVHGTYATGVPDRTFICEDQSENRFIASYTAPTTPFTLGFAEGRCHEEHKVCQGVFYQEGAGDDEDDFHGQTLYTLLDDDTLAETSFVGDWSANVQAQLDASIQEYLPRESDTAPEDECDANAFLLPTPPPPPPVIIDSEGDTNDQGTYYICDVCDKRLITRLWVLSPSATFTTQNVSDEFETGFGPEVSSLDGFYLYQGSIVNETNNYFQNVFEGKENAAEAQIAAVAFVETSNLTGQIEPVRFQQGSLQFFYTPDDSCFEQNEDSFYITTWLFILKDDATFNTQQVSNEFKKFAKDLSDFAGFRTYASMIPDATANLQLHNYVYNIYETQEQAAAANTKFSADIDNSAVGSQVAFVETFEAFITFDIGPSGAPSLVVSFFVVFIAVLSHLFF